MNGSGGPAKHQSDLLNHPFYKKPNHISGRTNLWTTVTLMEFWLQNVVCNFELFKKNIFVFQNFHLIFFILSSYYSICIFEKKFCAKFDRKIFFSSSKIFILQNFHFSKFSFFDFFFSFILFSLLKYSVFEIFNFKTSVWCTKVWYSKVSN